MAADSEEYNLLKDDKIINVLIGWRVQYPRIHPSLFYNSNSGYGSEISSLPYLSAKGVCDLCTALGVDMIYSERFNNVSSADLLKDALCRLESVDVSYIMLLDSIFDKRRFVELFRPAKSKKEVEALYMSIVTSAMDEINSVLYLRDHELIEDSGHFRIIKYDEGLLLPHDLIDIDPSYIHNHINRCEDKIKREEFESVIEESRKLIESVLCKILAEEGIEYKKNGKIQSYFNDVKDLLQIQDCTNIEKEDGDETNYPKYLSNLISALNEVMKTVAKLRNTFAHGNDTPECVKAKEYEARLAANAATTFSEYICSLYLDKKESGDLKKD